LAQELTRWIDAEPDAERLAPVPFSTVCFRWRPTELAQGNGTDREQTLDKLNEAILERVNRTGEAFLSHTRLDGKFTLRIAIGHLRTERRHVERAWELVREAAGGAA
jgi:aromatic-L-amino-acid/L-tryptophan decarboxylase